MQPAREFGSYWRQPDKPGKGRIRTDTLFVYPLPAVKTHRTDIPYLAKRPKFARIGALLKIEGTDPASRAVIDLSVMVSTQPQQAVRARETLWLIEVDPLTNH